MIGTRRQNVIRTPLLPLANRSMRSTRLGTTRQGRTLRAHEAGAESRGDGSLAQAQVRAGSLAAERRVDLADGLGKGRKHLVKVVSCQVQEFEDVGADVGT